MFICQSWQFLAQCFLPFLTIFNTILCQLLPYLAILDIPILPFLATLRVYNAGSVPMNAKVGNF